MCKMFKKVRGHKSINQFRHHSRLTKYTRTDSEVDHNTNVTMVKNSCQFEKSQKGYF